MAKKKNLLELLDFDGIPLSKIVREIRRLRRARKTKQAERLEYVVATTLLHYYNAR